MYKLENINLGKDEAEQDDNLRNYFLKTEAYNNSLHGKKVIVVGRKGSGKSAIFKLLQEDLEDCEIVITITPDQYSWSTLRDYKETGISREHSHTNAWKVTIISAVIWKLNEIQLFGTMSKLLPYYKYFKDSYNPTDLNWLLNISEKVKNILGGIKIEGSGFDFGSTVGTPLKIVNEMKTLLMNEWPSGKKVRILFDRLDDSWDATDESRELLIGLLKATMDINSFFNQKIICTVFIRSDIYSNLIYDDQDKIRQYEQHIVWDEIKLKEIIAERVKYSLEITHNTEKVWDTLFSTKLYRSSASAEKYIIDRTFKRPRDIISFVRLSLEKAIENRNKCIETTDTRLAEEQRYSESKYKDLIIENQKQFPFIKDLLDLFSSKLHKQTINEIKKTCDELITRKKITESADQLLRFLFSIGFIGIKRRGRAGVRQRGGERIYYSYDDPSLNPLTFKEFYIHPSMRHHLNIKEKRVKKV